MSKAEILAELPKLKIEERREIFERIGELEENELIGGSDPTLEEKKLLDRELEEFQQNPGAGSVWSDVESRLRKNLTRELACHHPAKSRGGFAKLAIMVRIPAGWLG